MLAASLMDYAMPRADLFPDLKTALSEVPSPTNPLGVRSGGEGGTTPALGDVINAIVDALSGFGVRHIEMPATPERVWRAIKSACVGGRGQWGKRFLAAVRWPGAFPCYFPASRKKFPFWPI